MSLSLTFFFFLYFYLLSSPLDIFLFLFFRLLSFVLQLINATSSQCMIIVQECRTLLSVNESQEIIIANICVLSKTLPLGFG